jgi:tRNA pseudouridine32 synthase/23S rRNA pseudouridine746 synthase
LDQATSGVLLLARHADSHRYFSRQFAQRRVAKIYEALLEGTLSQANGWITLPLSPDPHQPPRQQVDWQQGKASQTYFEVITGEDAPPIEGVTRVEMIPHTGRTHQLRVHAAHPQGLNAPILGDTLYGPSQDAAHLPSQRLHLHAKALTILHPHHQTALTLTAPMPF